MSTELGLDETVYVIGPENNISQIHCVETGEVARLLFDKVLVVLNKITDGKPLFSTLRVLKFNKLTVRAEKFSLKLIALDMSEFEPEGCLKA